MEARSLADINLLASNPPQYPVNPAEERREPLVLYISRVPGTRDVILSPFKPQLKNVSSEDIASSLYYIHLDTSPPNPIRNDDGRSSGEGSPSRRSIPRKPLPGGVNPSRPSESDMPRISIDNPAEEPEVLAPSHPPPHHMNPHPLPPLPADTTGSNSKNDHDLDGVLPPTSPPPSLIPGGKRGLDDDIPPPSYTPQDPILGNNNNDDDFLPPTTAPPLSIATGNRSVESFAPPPTGPPPTFEVQNQDPYDIAPPLPPRHLNLPSLQAGVPNRKPLGGPASAEEPFSSVERGYDVDYSPRPSTSRSRPEIATSPQSGRGRPSRSQSPRKHTELFSLVIIRRDPASGNQWNVGRVSCRPSDPVLPQDGPDMALSNALQYPPIDLQLENSGYAKFRKGMPRQSLDRNDDHSANAPPDPQHTDGSVFSRQIAMFYSKSWSTNVAEGFKKLDKNSFESFFKGQHGRKRSQDSVGEPGSPEGPSTSIGQPMPGMKPRGYIFSSPWGTRCEFRTGDAGRSLRLHHLLNEGASTQLNRFVADVQGPDAPNAPVLSELRFNLPSSEIFQQNPQDNQIKNLPQQQLGNLAKFWKRGENNGYDDEDDGEASPFDMNLGQELAGGGNRGKRAKMGKLIITHDGTKILDLVIAANIAVWWKAWERNF